MRRPLLGIALVATTLLVPRTVAVGGSGPFAGCQTPSATVVVGAVTCRRMPSADLGGMTAFSYFVPPDCAKHRCPTLYLLHGFGGDHTSMLGSASRPSAWVTALSRRPTVSPYATRQPWAYADPANWKPARQIDMVMVAPDGRTVPGGYGPQAWLEGFWTDWNPRYARGGADARYDTPAPRFASYLVDELVPFVQRHLPVGPGRAYRALAGTSLGGYGAYAIGLLHPDVWSSIGAVSGIMNVLLAPGLDPTATPGAPAGQPLVALPTARPPAPFGGALPLSSTPGPARDFAVVFYAFGDPTVDQAYFRGQQPVDLAMNGHARRRGRQSLAVRGFSNDTVPRTASDLTSPSDYPVAQAFEDFVFVSNIEMNRAFADEGVEQHYELHPGIHEDAYWNPWLRSQLSAQYASVRHWNGGGNPPPAAGEFSYGSIATSFTVWGWKVRVHRPVIEFLRMTSVNCGGFDLRGTGEVRIVVPTSCHTGVNGSRIVSLDLGPSMPTDAPVGADAAPTYGHTTHVTLTALR